MIGGKIYLTFPTDKGTNELLNIFAEIKGTTQPALLNEICQTYIQEKIIEILTYLEEKKIDINDILITKNKKG